jgi:hypothetical protein
MQHRTGIEKVEYAENSSHICFGVYGQTEQAAVVLSNDHAQQRGWHEGLFNWYYGLASNAAVCSVWRLLF